MRQPISPRQQTRHYSKTSGRTYRQQSQSSCYQIQSHQWQGHAVVVSRRSRLRSPTVGARLRDLYRPADHQHLRVTGRIPGRPGERRDRRRSRLPPPSTVAVVVSAPPAATDRETSCDCVGRPRVANSRAASGRRRTSVQPGCYPTSHATAANIRHKRRTTYVKQRSSEHSR